MWWCAEALYESARKAANAAAAERHRCFQLASQSYASMSGNSKQHAAVAAQPWLSKARDAHLHMRVAHARAALEIFRAKNAHRNLRQSVDLHGLHVTEALHVVKLLFTKLQERGGSGGGAPAGGLHIITGQSGGRKARLRPALEAFLKSKNKRFMASPSNPGELKVFL